MKKFTCIIITLIMVVLFASCAQRTPATIQQEAGANQRKIAENVPEALKKAIREAPDDVFIGIGAAKTAIVTMAIQTATTRAHADISKQINSVVQKMVINYIAGSDASSEDTLLFTETITRQTSNVTLPADDLVGLGTTTDKDGYTWVAISIKKEVVADQISHSVAEEIITIPAMSSFDAKAYFDEVFGETFDVELGAGAR